MAIQSGNPVEVIVADASTLVLSAMSDAFFQDGRFSLVATAATRETLLTALTRIPVAICVVDWNLSAEGGAKLVEALLDRPDPPRVVVYGGDSDRVPGLAMAAGAAAFVSRSGPVESLLQTCADVAAGKMVFPFVDVRRLQHDPLQSLSRKERQILDALAQGMTNRELSVSCDISINTVKFHLSNLYDKLAVKNRTQAIAFFYASRAGSGDGGAAVDS